MFNLQQGLSVPDQLNIQGLSLTEQPPQALRDLCGLVRDVAGMVLNRNTALSAQEWNVMCQKVEMQMMLVQQVLEN